MTISPKTIRLLQNLRRKKIIVGQVYDPVLVEAFDWFRCWPLVEVDEHFGDIFVVDIVYSTDDDRDRWELADIIDGKVVRRIGAAQVAVTVESNKVCGTCEGD